MKDSVFRGLDLDFLAYPSFFHLNKNVLIPIMGHHIAAQDEGVSGLVCSF